MKTFTSSKGAVLELRPVSQFKIDTLRASKPEIPVPTYTMKVAGGESFEYPLDEEIAKNKGRTDEWNAYITRVKQVEAENAKKFTELVIWEGLCVEVPDADSEWQRTSEYFGLKVPENPIERKLFYVYNELLGTPEDIGDLISEVLAISQVNEEAVEKLKSSFRASIQRKADLRVSKGKKSVVSKPDIQHP